MPVPDHCLSFYLSCASVDFLFICFKFKYPMVINSSAVKTINVLFTKNFPINASICCQA